MSKATKEAIKEIGRWALISVVAWVIGETLEQANVIPEFQEIRIVWFSYMIPVRVLFTAALTLAGRYIDKYKFINSKENPARIATETPTGLLPF